MLIQLKLKKRGEYFNLHYGIIYVFNLLTQAMSAMKSVFEFFDQPNEWIFQFMEKYLQFLYIFTF